MTGLLSFKSLKKLGWWYIAYEAVTFLAFVVYTAWTFGSV